MNSVDELKIDLKAVGASGEALHFSLDGAYFKALEQEEISDGRVEVSLKVRATAQEIFVLHYAIEGEVVVACDRCLAPLGISVDTDDDVTLRYASGNEEDYDGDAKLISYADRYYDIAWEIYESINLALPLVRMHEEGGCDAEMMRQLEKLKSGGDVN